jgi:hypothetical protein
VLCEHDRDFATDQRPFEGRARNLSINERSLDKTDRREDIRRLGIEAVVMRPSYGRMRDDSPATRRFYPNEIGAFAVWAADPRIKNSAPAVW